MKRRTLPDRRAHITQKVGIGAKRTLYLSVDSTTPSEVFIRVKQRQLDSEVVMLYDAVARIASLGLQYGVPLARIGETLLGTRSEPSGSVSGDGRIKFCNGSIDFVGRHVLVHYCGRTDLAHVRSTDA